MKLFCVALLICWTAPARADGPDVIYRPTSASCPAGYTTYGPPVQIGGRYYLECRRYGT
jgi:hypothetical protein